MGVFDKLCIERDPDRPVPCEGWKVRCPCHPDDKPSLHVSMGDDGRTVLMHCFAGCKTREVLKALGLGFKDLFVARGGGNSVIRSTPAFPVETYHPPLSCSDRSGVYNDLLDCLSLSDTHCDGLKRRGLDVCQIAANKYRTFSFFEGQQAVPRLLEKWKESLWCVPGFCSEGRWLKCPPGLLIPVRDRLGLIRALKVRPDDQGVRGKYEWVSSPSFSSGSPCHWALSVSGRSPNSHTVRVVEGPLKADVVMFLEAGTIRTVGIAGVTGWEKAMSEIFVAGIYAVRLAFDMDWKTKPAVWDNLVRCGKYITDKTPLAVYVETWDSMYGNGLDDYLSKLKSRIPGEPKPLCTVPFKEFVSAER